MAKELVFFSRADVWYFVAFSFDIILNWGGGADAWFLLSVAIHAGDLNPGII
jgi:hypothetical protein